MAAIGTPRRLIVAGVIAALLAGAGVAWAEHGDIPRGTTVLGLDLGGDSRAEAAAALRRHLQTRPELNAPVAVRVGDRTGNIRPADAGLRVDVDATIDAAARGRPSFFGTRRVEPVAAVDPKRLDAALRKAFPELADPLRKPAIIFDGLTPRPVYPKPSRDLDAARSAAAVTAGWIGAAGGQPITIPTVDTSPTTTREEVDRILTTLARPAVSAPVTVTSGRGTLSIPPQAIARSLILTADRTGKIRPRVDQAKLRTALAGSLARLETKPRDATVALAGGKPRITAGADGSTLDLTALAAGLLPVLQRADGRTVAGTLRTVRPKVTTDQVQKWRIAERISTFTTHFTGGLSSPRSQNIVQIAREVDGAVVRPGATFSLNGLTGERGTAEGYQEAPVIIDGKLTPGVGGGASQFTTTLFNASYYAGMQDVEHKPHSYWFSRYPAVIESTIFYPDLDFRFRNTSPYGVLIDTSYTGSTITVSFWSTKVWEKIATEWSPRRDVTNPKTITLKAGPDCIETAGLIGFTQDAWRLFYSGGKVVKREKFSWKYLPEPKYVCAPAP